MKINPKKFLFVTGVLIVAFVVLEFGAVNLFQRTLTLKSVTSSDLSGKGSSAEFSFIAKLNHLSMVEFYSEKNYIVPGENDSSIKIILTCSVNQDFIEKTIPLKDIALRGKQIVNFDQTLDCEGQKVAVNFLQTSEVPAKSVYIIFERTPMYTNGYPPRIGYKIYLKDVVKDFRIRFLQDKNFAYLYLSLMTVLLCSLIFLIVVEPGKDHRNADK